MLSPKTSLNKLFPFALSGFLSSALFFGVSLSGGDSLGLIFSSEG